MLILGKLLAESSELGHGIEVREWRHIMPHFEVPNFNLNLTKFPIWEVVKGKVKVGVELRLRLEMFEPP
jgi:hypothetical protein